MSSEAIIDPMLDTVSQFLLQMMVITVIVRVLGALLKRVHQPMVVGEILAGILLGPSVMGWVPGFSNYLFSAASLPYLNLLAQLGLIFFMFFLGLELETEVFAAQWKQAIPITIVSLSIPFAAGCALTVWLYDIPEMVPSASIPEFHVYLMFIGVACSITALPVLARVIQAANLTTAPVGMLTLACATINDVIGWCVLALTEAMARGSNPLDGLYTTLIVAGFVAFSYFFVGPLFQYMFRKCHSTAQIERQEFDRSYMAAVFVGLCLCAWFCESIGVHAMFGAFVFGLLIPKQGNFADFMAQKIEILVVEFFLPLYFANSGLRTQVATINTGELWGATVVIIVVCTAVKVLPVAVATRLYDHDWRFSWAVGFMMNTRGLVSLIVLNVGLDLGIISVALFSSMVLMSIVTTLTTAPVLYYVYQRHQPPDKKPDQLTPSPPDPSALSHSIDIRPRGSTLGEAERLGGDPSAALPEAADTKLALELSQLGVLADDGLLKDPLAPPHVVVHGGSSASLLDGLPAEPAQQRNA